MSLDKKAEKGGRKESARDKQGLWVSIALEIHNVGSRLPRGASHVLTLTSICSAE